MRIIRNCDKCDKEDSIDAMSGLCPSCEEKEYTKNKPIEQTLKEMIISQIDETFKTLIDKEKYDEFKQLGRYLTDEEIEEVESILMSYRNIIAGTDWDGEMREYEFYKVRK